MARLTASRTVWIVAAAIILLALAVGGTWYVRVKMADVHRDSHPIDPGLSASDASGRGMPRERVDPAGRSSPSTPTQENQRPRCLIQFDDVSRQSGVAFVHTHGGSDQRYIMETVTTGLATLDYDGDGLVDVYFPNGAPLRGTVVDRSARHALYKNLGRWKFRDVTDESGVACTAFGLGIAVADYDQDGWPDIYLNNHSSSVLYRNRGNGTFADATRQAGVGRADKVGAGACFLDADKDGYPDLFAAAYVKFDYETHRAPLVGQNLFYPGPLNYPPDAGDLYRNRGDGSFTNVSGPSGIGRRLGAGMGVVCCDYDRDGDTDIFVGNDEMANFLFQNDGAGRFDEVAIPSGFAYDGAGMAQGTMGVECGDYDHDGWLDLYATAYQGEVATLYRNLGGGLFQDVSRTTGAGQSTAFFVTWGCGLVDFDNDGDRDLFVATGHVDRNAPRREYKATYAVGNILLRNLLMETGHARFDDVSDQCGDGLLPEFSSRGAVFEDLDNDGDMDVIVLNSQEKPTILRNTLQERGSTHHWVAVRLRGVKTNRDGIGAQVTVVAGKHRQVAEVHSGRGYQGHWGSRLHFGLGAHPRIDRIEIRWIGGGIDLLEDLGADRLLTVTEGIRGP